MDFKAHKQGTGACSALKLNTLWWHSFSSLHLLFMPVIDTTDRNLVVLWRSSLLAGPMICLMRPTKLIDLCLA